MPNLQPPITQVSQAVAYHNALSRIAPGVKFLMSLFLHPTFLNNVDAIIAEAARSKIIYGASEQSLLGKTAMLTNIKVKLYPAGVLMHLYLDNFIQIDFAI